MATPCNAAESQRRLIYQLRADERPAATTLVRLLERCRPNRPCRSAACPLCGEAFQQAALAAVERFIRAPARAQLRGRMSAITIIPASGVVEPDQLTVELYTKVSKEIMGALRALKLPPSIIGLEISFDEDLTGKVPPHWCGHGHVVGLDWLAAKDKQDLRRSFLAFEWVKRPVHIQELNDNIRGRLNVQAERVSIGPQPDPRCTVIDPVRLTGLKLRDGADVALPDKPTVACATAETFAAFVRDLLGPLSKGSFGTSLDAIWTGPGLECRTRDHIAGAKLSAHGQGLAIDIAQLRLSTQRLIEVGRPKGDADQGFEAAARAGACGYFHTALGPGADAFHETHWHFDILPRGSKGDSKFCQ